MITYLATIKTYKFGFFVFSPRHEKEIQPEKQIKTEKNIERKEKKINENLFLKVVEAINKSGSKENFDR